MRGKRLDAFYDRYLDDDEKMLKEIDNLNSNIVLLVEVLVDIRDILSKGYKVEIKVKE